MKPTAILMSLALALPAIAQSAPLPRSNPPAPQGQAAPGDEVAQLRRELRLLRAEVEKLAKSLQDQPTTAGPTPPRAMGMGGMSGMRGMGGGAVVERPLAGAGGPPPALAVPGTPAPGAPVRTIARKPQPVVPPATAKAEDRQPVRAQAQAAPAPQRWSVVQPQPDRAAAPAPTPAQGKCQCDCPACRAAHGQPGRPGIRAVRSRAPQAGAWKLESARRLGVPMPAPQPRIYWRQQAPLRAVAPQAGHRILRLLAEDFAQHWRGHGRAQPAPAKVKAKTQAKAHAKPKTKAKPKVTVVRDYKTTIAV